MNDINCRMPVLALRGLVCLPDMVLNFDVSRKKSIAALEAAMVKDQMIFLVTQQDPDEEEPSLEKLYRIGTMAKIKQIVKMPENMVRVLAEGKFRAEIDEMISLSPYLLADVIIHDTEDKVENENEAEAMREVLEGIIEQYQSAGTKFSIDIMKQLKQSKDIVRLTNHLCGNMPMHWQDRQKLVEKLDFRERYEELCRIMNKEYEILLINQEIQGKVKARIEKNQREYVLREQLKLIREELGDDLLSEAQEYEEKLENLKAPAVVKEKLDKEIRRFKTLAGNSAESSVARTYIDTLFEIPWSKSSRDNRDIDKAEKILREDHYGLEKVKERILEYLSVRLLTKKGDSPILCLVGPPGTGKTSIARSIARALNKKYVRISLGGVHDEAEIRGHRRTYIGAMPGRITAAISQAGVRNPVMLLDEIDKVSTDYKGDTFSALLEVLDSEQNCNFRDNYLEVPLDLSDVLFIATANTLSTIPRPLLDRMEVIEINTYTQNEKLHIAKEHLLAKQMKANGIHSKQLTVSDKAIESIILHYTREAGVRGLERCLGDICRKTARMILQDGRKNVKVTDKNIEHFLGIRKYDFEAANEHNETGIVRGLAWTSVGGDTLSVEVNIMPGKGKFELTGQLGDVMKESAMAGISYIRSVSEQFGIDKTFFEENDIHIHIPEGAVPKDGPSAGVTMTTAMLSAITGIPVRADVAMTGEITLRGRVLPIGGLREKSIAAKVAGIHTVIVPEKNRKDIKELDKEITRDMEFVYASNMADILPVALESMPDLKTAGA
ncbi:MAG: endopeptidase La [Coprococcus sp.]